MHLQCKNCGGVKHAFFKGNNVKRDYEGVIFIIKKYETKFYIEVYNEDDMYMGDINESKAINAAYDNLFDVEQFTCALCDAQVEAMF